jgi:predicted nucleic acid-binding protein
VLVVDASLMVAWATGAHDLGGLAPDERCAPTLMWSEARSVLHERMWRGDIPAEHAQRARARIEQAPVEPKAHPDLADEAWRIAEELGWAKTYDAEYVALASLLGCRLVTVDGRLRRGADRLGFVVGPTEL